MGHEPGTDPNGGSLANATIRGVGGQYISGESILVVCDGIYLILTCSIPRLRSTPGILLESRRSMQRKRAADELRFVNEDVPSTLSERHIGGSGRRKVVIHRPLTVEAFKRVS